MTTAMKGARSRAWLIEDEQSIAALAAALGVTQRAAVEAELRECIGPRRVAAATRVMREVLDLHGATAAVRARRVRPPG